MKVIHKIEEVCQFCGYYDCSNEHSEFTDHCTHPNAWRTNEGLCMASGCPMFGLAEELDYKEAGYSDVEASEGDRLMDSVFIYINDNNDRNEYRKECPYMGTTNPDECTKRQKVCDGNCSFMKHYDDIQKEFSPKA